MSSKKKESGSSCRGGVPIAVLDRTTNGIAENRQTAATGVQAASDNAG